ncbi:uroporphyrinogen-III synthase [Gellertiella hungarica]|uniref:Uroporphyrinogen-III synthase n=1 Tax=Gellertiella hungarica TaxID=1572859 RepID=A0A7W6J7C3_9HYPH|nr:uroporphyrinogen-III synthase [Gellertiella hungarica]MBB4065238.1 uroporphyrinogen-III synthase [Gellertiella hungarica]
MRVVVTRPAPSAEKTARLLAAMGHDAAMLPLFRAEHLPLLPARWAGSPPGGFLFTSAEALRSLSTAGGMPEELKNLPVYAVGKATADKARTEGFTRVHVASGYGADLAELVAAERDRYDQPLLYLAGEPRSPALEEGLRQKGVAFHTLVAYRMIPLVYRKPDMEGALGNGNCAVLLYSKEACHRFVSLCEETGCADRIREVEFYCLSPAIAAGLPAEASKRARTASETTEEALLSLLPSR